MERTTIVQTGCGGIRGLYDNEVFVWRGIRYAKPLTAKTRFQAPLPMEPWEGVYDATEYKEVFPQKGNDLGWVSADASMDEDCLYLNIWSPVPDDKKRPVLFWIHGGAYTSGSGSVEFFDGANFARSHDVVVVTINYRLSYLGFLDFSAFSNNNIRFDSNIGLKDQALALQWVYDHIGHFGGDPDNITVFGESAGATSTVALMAVPSVRPLISKAIVQSGCPDMVQHKGEAKQYAGIFLELLHIPPGSVEKILDVPLQTLMKASQDLMSRVAKDIPGKTAFSPVVDGEFLPKHPIRSVQDGDAGDIPLLIGTNTDEGTIFAKSEAPLVPTTEESVDLFFRQKAPGAKESILSSYGTMDDKKKYLAVGRDLFFRMPSQWFACDQSKHTDTWIYQFDYAPQALKLAGLGAMHGAEIIMVFGNLECRAARMALLLTPSRKKVHDLSLRMQNDWVHFARHGELTWRPYTEERRLIKVYGMEDSLQADMDKDIREAWESTPFYTKRYPAFL